MTAGGWSRLDSDELGSSDKIVKLVVKMWKPHGVYAFVSGPGIS